MEDTKNNPDDLVTAGEQKNIQEQKVPQRASFLELYSLLTFSYKALFFLGVISAFVGGKD